MRSVNIRKSFEAYLSGQKLLVTEEDGQEKGELASKGNLTGNNQYGNMPEVNISKPKTLSEIAITAKQSSEVDEQFRQLVEYVRQYRHYQKLYFQKLKRNEFAKDEQHFMMRTQEKIDQLLKSIPF